VDLSSSDSCRRAGGLDGVDVAHMSAMVTSGVASFST